MNKIITVYFNYGDSDKFEILHKIFIHSINANIPHCKTISYFLPEPEIRYNRSRAFISNSVKLEKWVEELRLCDDGDCIALMDCDMLVLSDFFDIFDENFDIGYTKRTNSKWPLNGGVLFIKKNIWSLMFMNTLLKVNNAMLEDVNFNREWQRKYGGINQAALGHMIEGNMIFNIKAFPCAVYNACGEDLPNFDENKTKILHIKGKLRQAIFGETKTEHELTYPVSLWKKCAGELQLF